MEEILALDEDKENRSVLEKYGFSFVSCDTPTLLAVNATQTVLAVCTKNSSGIVLLFYSLSNFPGFVSIDIFLLFFLTLFIVIYLKFFIYIFK